VSAVPTLAADGAGAAKIFAVVGASGAGKDTLLDGLARARPDIHRARRTISRPPAEMTEPFESVSPDAFAALRASGAFALCWKAHGLGYGIRHAELERAGTVVFNGSRKALPQALARYPGLRVIVVTVSPETLAARLAARGREDAEEIARRLARPAAPLPEGVIAHEVRNDGSPAEGVARLVAALDTTCAEAAP
jgi:ribose 1,5-bisphosphokinase